MKRTTWRDIREQQPRSTDRQGPRFIAILQRGDDKPETVRLIEAEPPLDYYFSPIGKGQQFPFTFAHVVCWCEIVTEDIPEHFLAEARIPF